MEEEPLQFFFFSLLILFMLNVGAPGSYYSQAAAGASISNPIGRKAVSRLSKEKRDQK